MTHRLIAVDGKPIGFVTYRRDRDGLLLDQVAVQPAQRNRGYGAEAIYAVEEEEEGVRWAETMVPHSNGLAIYFWLRIGYHPLIALKGIRTNATVMIRDLRG